MSDIVSTKEQIKNTKQEIDEMIRTESIFVVNFKDELRLYDPSVIFEHKDLLTKVLSSGKMKVKKNLNWENIYREIDPIEVYILLKSIILKQPPANIAHVMSGEMSEDEIMKIQKSAFSRMRKMTIFENIYL